MQFIGSVLVVHLVVGLVKAKIPQFLFLGQSNMVGTVKLFRFFKTIDLLLTNKSDKQLKNNLVNYFQTANSSFLTPRNDLVRYCDSLYILVSPVGSGLVEYCQVIAMPKDIFGTINIIPFYSL